MADRDQPADLSAVKTYALNSRASKVQVSQFGQPVGPDSTLAEFIDGLSDLLAVQELRGLAGAIAKAKAGGRPVYWALGGHVIKCGLAPLLIDLMKGGFVDALVLNGASAIHDWEVGFQGATSEVVEDGLPSGTFGMAEETGAAWNAAAKRSAKEGRGIGTILGEELAASAEFASHSLLAQACELDLPVTVHASIGTDIVHQHPTVDGASLGSAAYLDFRRLVSLVARLQGGVWLNCGSAVLLPEVFLKALSVARNLGHEIAPITTANLDMQRHYRTTENVLRRPSAGGGQSFQLIGHHEIQIPLLAAAIKAAATSSAAPR